MTSPTRLLICDDDEIDRMSVVRQLRDSKFVITECDCAEQAYKSLAENTFDCILLDFRMPDIDGLSALSHIKENQLSTAPIIMLSGLEDEELSMQCLQKGAQDYILKAGVKKDLLLRSIRYACERESLEQKLQQALEQANQANRTKSEFLANMSHELRTPLNSLLILSKALSDNEEGNLTPSQIEDASYIHESGQELLELINDILDLSKVEAGKLDIHRGRVFVSSLVDSLHKRFSPLSKQRSLPFKIECEDGVTDIIITDNQRLQQILKNFLSNAFKFTKEGAITLQVFEVDDNERFSSPYLSEGKVIGFSITDTGIGIPSDKQEAIFQPFEQEDGSISRKFGGTGLGLTIARQLTGLLKGEIKVVSALGEGSTFTLYLPVSLSEDDENLLIPDQHDIFVESTQTPEQENSIDKKSHSLKDEANTTTAKDTLCNRDTRVLLVDDDIVNAFVLAKQLTASGMQVSIADNGKMAVDKLDDSQFDIVLMDLMMPVMDGYDAMQAIRRSERYSGLPIIVLSANALDNEREKCENLGASDFMQKPVDVDLLKNKIISFLGSG